MCNTNVIQEVNPKIEFIKDKIRDCENMSLKIKSMKFENFQSFDFVYNNFVVGEVYDITGVGYSVITSKTEKEVCFVVFMEVNNIWQEHFQDVDKHLIIKQGVYMDLYTGKEYKKEVRVKAFEPSYFKSVGDKMLIIKGRVYR